LRETEPIALLLKDFARGDKRSLNRLVPMRGCSGNWGRQLCLQEPCPLKMIDAKADDLLRVNQ